MKNLWVVFCLPALATSAIFGQETFPVNDVQDNREGAYAFTNATIHVDYQTTVEGGVLLIRDGLVEKAGKNLNIPAGYTAIDLKGKHVYPSWIDIYTDYGLPEAPGRAGNAFSGAEKITPQTEGAYNANDAIKAHYHAAEGFKVDGKAAKSMRELGFGTVASFMADGIARGSSTLVTLAEDAPNEVMLLEKAAAHYSFSKGSSSQYYPVSPMGAIALMRQTYLDAEWYGAQDPRPFTDQTLEAWIGNQTLPQIFETTNWVSLLRADKLGDEFGVQYIFKSTGDAYQRIDAVKKTGGALIVPLNFPEALDVEDPFDAKRATLRDMKHWELAPANLAALERAGVPFALTTRGLSDKERGNFWAHVKKTVEHGASEAAVLKALTFTPARLMGQENRLGSLKAGMIANFLVTSDSLFAKKAEIHQNWIQGKPYTIKDPDEADYSGKFKLTLAGTDYDLVVTGKPGDFSAEIPVEEGDAIKVKANFDKEMATLSFSPEEDKGAIRLSGWREGRNWKGNGALADETWVAWSAEYLGEPDLKEDEKDGEDSGEKEEKADKSPADDLGKVFYPFVAYGHEAAPQAETILIKNATVWTNEADGILHNTDVLVKDGKIAKIGKNLSARGAREIDGSGKHLTPGIVDEHSHIAINGVNDVATNSSMVRIGDVIDPEDIDVYRNLAGGVVAAQLLHGSSNPIGGQSALVKLRWGALAEEMKIQGADEFIKFALGENVKRSFNSDSDRYPQSRMGVEQVFMDAFSSARDYEREWKAYNALSANQKASATKPRRDLAMDAMVEILNAERFISCHSYVQSEINMLMKVAELFGFRVNTFTHILEGYKVADKMRDHGAGGSTFADWWAYKWEVRYAIPYNTTLMNGVGVVTAVNSDSAEMSRRLNQEAAKSVKYGGMSEEDALKMVTLNPAKLLHLDDRMGSVKVGKDADLVVWSDHPLSIYAKAEQTMVDGIVYFDVEQDRKLREEVRRERARLIQKMRDHKKNGGKSKKPKPKRHAQWHCEDILAPFAAELQMETGEVQ